MNNGFYRFYFAWTYMSYLFQCNSNFTYLFFFLKNWAIRNFCNFHPQTSISTIFFYSENPLGFSQNRWCDNLLKNDLFLNAKLNGLVPTCYSLISTELFSFSAPRMRYMVELVGLMYTYIRKILCYDKCWNMFEIEFKIS